MRVDGEILNSRPPLALILWQWAPLMLLESELGPGLEW